MATRVLERVHVPLSPEQAEALWTDVRRWPSFVEGFRHAVELSDSWPEAGSRVSWESGPGGRGRVTEKVREREPGQRLATFVFEERMGGEQQVTFAADEAGTLITVDLSYELTASGPLRALANALFIRRAVSDALARTLRRFAIEADEEAQLAS